jgi:Flp pilus assembly pilin Flp
MRTLLQKFIGNENGATSIEYGILAVFIFLAISGGIAALGGKTSGGLNGTITNVSKVL